MVQTGVCSRASAALIGPENIPVVYRVDADARVENGPRGSSR